MSGLASFSIPGLKLVSEANAHEHWRIRQKRAKAQRGTAMMLTRSMGPTWSGEPMTITIVRIAPRELDSDNLVGSAKHVRDGVADALGVNDRDKRLTWIVRPEKGRVGEYAVRVEFETMGADRWDGVVP